MNLRNLLNWLISFYALTLPFQRLFYSDTFKYKLQLPEIIFIPILLTSVLAIKWKEVNWKIFLPVLLFIGWTGITALYHRDRNSYLEFAGLFYLTSLALIIGSLDLSKPEVERILRFFIYGVAANALLAVIGFFLWQNNIPNQFAMFYDNYPVMGSIARGSGFTSHPIMMGNLVIVALCLLYGIKIKYRNILAAILFAGLIVTFTKAVLLIIVAICLLKFFTNRTDKASSVAYGFSALIFTMIHLLLTHVNISSSEGDRNTRYWSDEVVSIDGFKPLHTTSYLYLKERCFNLGIKHPVFGVGGGNTNDVQMDSEPQNKNAGYDPHSLYFGTFAEYGIPGLILLVLALFFTLKTIMALGDDHHYLQIPFMLIFIFMVLEGISSDIINYRQNWLLLGILFNLSSKQTVIQGNKY